MKPQEIQDRRFSTAFRGYDPTEVRQFLAHIAGLYADLQARIEPSESVTVVATTDASDSDDASESGAPEGSALDSGGESAETVTAAELVAQAQREADDLLAAARTEAQTIVARANDEAARVVLRARAESRGKPSAERNAAIEAALAEVPGDPEQAREQARLMISEARAVRERILSDLAKRRRTAHVQLEQLRVAREKLLETLRDARRVVEDASRDLSTAEVEARLAAETAGRRVANEPMPGVEELEAELFGGRFLTSADSSGRPLVGPAPVATADSSVEPVAVVADSAEVVVDSEAVESAEASDRIADGVSEVVVESMVAVVVADAPDVVVSAVDDVPAVAGEAAADAELVDEVPDGVDDTVEPVVANDEAAAMAIEADGASPVAAVTAGVDADEEPDHDATAVKAETHDVVVDLADRADDAPTPSAPVDVTPPKRSVDDLFARLRAERTEAADRARIELAKPPVVAPAPVVTSESVDIITMPPDDAEAIDGEALIGEAIDGDASGAADVIEAEGVHELAVVIDVTGRMGTAAGLALADGSEIDATVLLDEPAGIDSGINVVTDELGQDPTNVADLVTQRVARAIKRHLRDEQGSALVALRTARGLPHIDALLGTDDEQRGRLRSALDGAIEGETGLHPARAASIAHDIAGSIRAEVAAALADTASGSTDASELPESIAAAYRAWTIERLDALVRPGVAISA